MSSERVEILARKLGAQIRISELASAYKGEILSASAEKILIANGKYSYIYVQESGEIAFSSCEENLASEFLHFVKPFVEFPVREDEVYRENFLVEINSDLGLQLDYNSIQLPAIDASIIEIVLLNISRSVAMDYYIALGGNLLRETTNFTAELELKGKLSISKSSLLKFIGRVLNTHNHMIESLHFLDDPDTAWESEYLAEINAGLSQTFKLKRRFRKLECIVSSIDKSLNSIVQLSQHRESKKLDLIIIILIAFEIVNALIHK